MQLFKLSGLNKYFLFVIFVISSCVIVFGNEMAKKNRAENNSYVLATGSAGAKALDIQQEYVAKGSYDLLQKAGLKPGMVVYDIGCGSGAMTVYLAQQVGSKGHVFAVDISEEQLNITKQKVKEEGLNNVSFIQADVQKFEVPSQVQADIIYFRFVLVHLQEPEVALKNMYRLLKIGGKLAFQEPTWETIHTNYPKDFLNEYRDAVIKLGKMKRVNYNLGHITPEMACHLPNSIVGSYELENKINLRQYKELAIIRLAEMGTKLVAAGLIAEEILLNWSKEIDSMPIEDDRYFVNLGNLTCVIVEKSKSIDLNRDFFVVYQRNS